MRETCWVLLYSEAEVIPHELETAGFGVLHGSGLEIMLLIILCSGTNKYNSI